MEKTLFDGLTRRLAAWRWRIALRTLRRGNGTWGNPPEKAVSFTKSCKFLGNGTWGNPPEKAAKEEFELASFKTQIREGKALSPLNLALALIREEAQIKRKKDRIRKEKARIREEEEKARIRKEIARIREEEEEKARIRKEKARIRKKEEKARIREEEKARIREEEKARIRKKEEKARIREEEKARIRKEEEEKARIRKEKEALLQRIATEKRTKLQETATKLRRKADEFAKSDNKVTKSLSVKLREKIDELDKMDVETIKRKIQENEAKEETAKLLQSADVSVMELIGMNCMPANRKPIPSKWKDSLYEQQKGFCFGCKRRFEVRNLSVDHIKPVQLGGETELDNLQLLCQSCNSTKGTGTQEELISKLTKGGIL